MYDTSFYCREAKKNRKGYSIIQMSVTFGEKRTFISLPRKEKPEEFKRLIESKKDNDLKKYLDLMKRQVDTIRTEVLAAGQPWTPETLRDYMRSGGIRSYTIDDMFNDFLKVKKKEVEAGTIKETMHYKYTIVQRDFYEYLKKENITPAHDVNVLTNMIVMGFYAHLNSTAKKSTTAGKMTKLKAVTTAAFKGGRMKTDPFNMVIIRKPKPVIEFLTEEEYMCIKTKDFHCDRLNKVRDLFIFQANSGLSYADMAKLKEEDIRESNGICYISSNRIKTGVEYTAVILTDGMEIFRRYKGNLPVLSNQRYNAYLKEIQEVSGCNTLIHSHLARKTYTTRCLNQGIRAETVKALLGHSDVKMTLSTYGKLNASTICREVGRAFGMCD